MRSYKKVQEAYPDARTAGAKLIAQSKQSPGRITYIYVNNRLEGNALENIDEMLAHATALEESGNLT